MRREAPSGRRGGTGRRAVVRSMTVKGRVGRGCGGAVQPVAACSAMCDWEGRGGERARGGCLSEVGWCGACGTVRDPPSGRDRGAMRGGT